MTTAQQTVRARPLPWAESAAFGGIAFTINLVCALIVSGAGLSPL